MVAQLTPSPATMLTLKQAAIILAISDRQIDRLVRAGRIPAKNVGTGRTKTWRLKLADVEAFRDTPDNNAAPINPPAIRLPSHVKNFVD